MLEVYLRVEKCLSANFFCLCAFCSGLSAGVFITSTAESCCYVANSCKANIVVVENETQLQKILQASQLLVFAIVKLGM